MPNRCPYVGDKPLRSAVRTLVLDRRRGRDRTPCWEHGAAVGLAGGSVQRGSDGAFAEFGTGNGDAHRVTDGWPLSAVLETGAPRLSRIWRAAWSARRSACIRSRRTPRLSCRCGSRARTASPGSSWRGSARACRSTTTTEDFSICSRASFATAVANARAYEEERRRAEALAEARPGQDHFLLQRQPRVPHAADADARPGRGCAGRARRASAGRQREPLEVVHRNGLRLQKLVNTLLDFSRIEAGRVQAAYRADRPGRVDRRSRQQLPLGLREGRAAAAWWIARRSPQPVYVDRDMWEKIVLNLLSNAFKFTFEGEIAVTLRAGRSEPMRVELRVCGDTGTGISAGADAAPVRAVPPRRRSARADARRHRASGWRWCRNWSGCTAADVRAESRLGEGTHLHVTIPAGHGDTCLADRIGAARTLASTTRRRRLLTSRRRCGGCRTPSGSWESQPEEEVAAPSGRAWEETPNSRGFCWPTTTPTCGITCGACWRGSTMWTAVSDGLAALAAARERPPDLVLSDVMMPRAGRFRPAQGVAQRPAHGRGSVLVALGAVWRGSPRGGDSSRGRRLPHQAVQRERAFGAVQAHLELAKLRRRGGGGSGASEQKFRTLSSHAPVGIFQTDAQGHCLFVNECWCELAGISAKEAEGEGWNNAIHPEDRQRVWQEWDACAREQREFACEYRFLTPGGKSRGCKAPPPPCSEIVVRGMVRCPSGKRGTRQRGKATPSP